MQCGGAVGGISDRGIQPGVSDGMIWVPTIFEKFPRNERDFHGNIEFNCWELQNDIA